MLACDCLNVIIETEEDDFQKVTAADLSLTPVEVHDPFFKQDIQQVGKLININKSHSGLIQTRNVGCWVVHYCINCDVHSHAVHREKGASCVLVNSKLLGTESVSRLKSSDKFSKLYKIVIRPERMEDEDVVGNSYLPSDVENVVKGLKQIAAEALKNESLAVEERIKAFTDEQYNMLNEMRERTFREQQALIRIILNNTVGGNNSKQSPSTNQGMSSSATAAMIMPSRLNEPLAAGSVKSGASPNTSIHSNRHTPKRQKSCPAGKVHAFDSEGLFAFDGIDDVQSAEDSEEVEESDIDDGAKDDSVKIPRSQRGGGGMIAKSLPMSIPVFMSQARNRSREDVDDIRTIENNLDIAASMRALARSVHGDTVFGDLPKPRYSTYI